MREKDQEKIEKITLTTLEQEEQFHDHWASTVDLDTVMVDETFEACTSPENKIILNWLGDIKGRKILELGCGLGETSTYFAKCGADVTASDISAGMLKTAEKLAEKHNVKIHTVKGPADALPLPDACMDVVYAANLLHHVDLRTTLAEAKRILKPGGVFVSWDPLIHNPVINCYRKIATAVRTESEHPIHMKQLKVFHEVFGGIQYETTWFFTNIIFLKYFFVDRINPNKERFWKKIVTDHKIIEGMYNRWARVDKVFLKWFPFMRRYCWNIVIRAQKQEENDGTTGG